MQRLIGALLAAAMLAPAAAQAQRDGNVPTEQRGPRGGRGAGDFGPDRAPADMNRPDGSRPGFGRQFDDRHYRGDDRRPSVGVDRLPSDRRGFGDDSRLRRGSDLRAERDRAFTADRRADGDRSRFDRGDRNRDWRSDRNDGWRGDRNTGWRSDRNDGWRGDRGGWRDDRWQRDGRGDRADWRGGDWNGRGSSRWDRGWQGQSRYDWVRYRDANRSAFRLPRYYAPGGWTGGYRRFGIGFSLSSALWGRNYWISDPYAYRLPEAYGPYRWVRYYDDALLVDLDSGQVVDAVYGIFW